MALDKLYAGRLDAAKIRLLHDKIANDYANQGVAAEDRKDPSAAVIAYRHAIEWNPSNAKARFNLGAIYIEDKRYNLAEGEYKALVQADAPEGLPDALAEHLRHAHPEVEFACYPGGDLGALLLVGVE